MKIELHKAQERGHANYGWLDTWHSFSFADYFNPIREQFGALRVLNDDTIKGGTGFDEHPHNNMEIITIPLDGKLEHKDSMGHIEIIGPGDVQVMSAGTGIRHSEYNHLPDLSTNFLQIWIYTRNRNITPSYDQKSFDPIESHNKFQCLVSPEIQAEKNSLCIHQDAWIFQARMQRTKTLEYKIHSLSNCIYTFIIEGSVLISGHHAGKRDAIGLKEVELLEIESLEDSYLLVIEVPEK